MRSTPVTSPRLRPHALPWKLRAYRKTPSLKWKLSRPSELQKKVDYGRSGLSRALWIAKIVTAATAATAYHTNLLLAAMMGGRPEPFDPAPCGGGWSCASSLSVGSSTMRYALPSGIGLESSPTVI